MGLASCDRERLGQQRIKRTNTDMLCGRYTTSLVRETCSRKTLKLDRSESPLLGYTYPRKRLIRGFDIALDSICGDILPYGSWKTTDREQGPLCQQAAGNTTSALTMCYEARSVAERLMRVSGEAEARTTGRNNRAR
jgi:hypothetical protein